MIFFNKKIKNLTKDQKGVTLLELMVSVSIFSVIIVITFAIFKMMMDGQQSAIASQNTQETLRYAYEIMAKEIRTSAGVHTGSDCGPTYGTPGIYKTFNTELGSPSYTGAELFFKNKDNLCVRYYLDNKRIMISRRSVIGPAPYAFDLTLPLTPEGVEIEELFFWVKDDFADDFHTKQPRVTIKMEVQPKTVKDKFRNTFDIQTTVSARFYE